MHNHPSKAGDPVHDLSRLVAGSTIDGVALRRLTMHHDHRGCFTEVFQRSWGTCITPVQWSVVQSRARVFRGVHLHRRHDEYFSVLQGRATVGLRDIRPWSPTRDRWVMYELSGADLACVTFPLGVLHGWYFHEDTLHLQAVSEAYIDYGKDDNWGCVWSDPALEIPWPITEEPIVTPRAGDFPSLRTLLDALGDWRVEGRGSS
jgi:dTDP-4-dehydrorhamnose 3,5-epimerase